MRSEKELLELLLENINWLSAGLCNLAFDLLSHGVMNSQEYAILHQLIWDNEPFTTYDKYYFWLPGNKEPRIDFLNQLIKKYGG